MSDDKKITPEEKKEGVLNNEEKKDIEVKEEVNLDEDKKEVENMDSEENEGDGNKESDEKLVEAKIDPKKDEKEIDFRKELKPGMTIRLHQRIKELNTKGEEKQRIQYFEGIIIAKKHGTEPGASITVRKVSNGVGVEKIFPLNLPSITKIEIKKEADVKRAKLGYVKRGYKKKLKEKRVDRIVKDLKEEKKI